MQFVLKNFSFFVKFTVSSILYLLVVRNFYTMNNNELRFGLTATEQGDPERASETQEVVTEKQDFEARCSALNVERMQITREREITFGLAHMATEGFGTLFEVFGVDAVFDTIEKQERESGDDGFCAFEVICDLEPSKTKREELYEEMLRAATAFEEEQRKEELQTRRRKDTYFGNFAPAPAMAIRHKVSSLRSLDSVFGILHRRMNRVMLDRLEEYASFMKDGDKKLEIREQLARAENDIVRLVNERADLVREREDHYTIEASVLHKDLQREIERITGEINEKLEKYRAEVLSDLAKVSSLETTTPEMRTALEEALTRVESQIATKVAEADEEKERRTAPLKELMRWSIF